MDRVRLKDIAESVGCSVAVVSHVVNHSTGNVSCGDDLRDRILRRARELHYAPHYASRALRGRRSATLGAYAAPQSEAFAGLLGASRVLEGVGAACREAAYDLLLVGPGGGREAEECAAKLLGRRIDGLVLAGLPEGADWLAPLVALDANAVAVNYFGPVPVDAINFDVRAATELAVRALARLGHRRIGYLGAPEGGEAERLRREGYDAAMDGLVPGDGGRSPEEGGDDAPGAAARRAALAFSAARRDARPTAFVVHSDLDAVRLLMEFRRLGVECPRDVSVLGIGGGPLCETVFPRLSSVRQPLPEMGAEAARRALRRFEERLAEGESDEAPSGPLPTELRTRGRRGRRPAAVSAAIAAEAEARARQAPARLPPARERWLRRARPELALRESSAPPAS